MLIEIHQSDDNFEITENIVHVIEVAPFGQPDGITESIFTAKGQLLSASAADTPAVVPAPGADGYVPIADASQTTGIRWGTPSISVEDTTSQLINGGFDLAQRQAPGTDTTITDEKYSADRWRTTRETAALQYSRQDASAESGLYSRYYGKFTKITNAGKFAVYQPLEFAPSLPLRGKSVIFQVAMKASTAKTIKIAIVELQAAGTADTLPAAFVGAWNADSTDPTLGTNLAVVGAVQSCSVTTSWQTFSVTGTVPADSKNLIVAVWTNADFSASDYLCLAEAGLYRGASTRTWAPRQLPQEISLCQRYYYKSFTLDTAPAQSAGKLGCIMGIATKAGANVNYIPVRLPAPMRISPTVTTYNPSAANAEFRDSIVDGDCSLTTEILTVKSESQIAFSTTGNAGTAVGNPMLIHVTAEAEL